jgi:hypothetical protein
VLLGTNMLGLNVQLSELGDARFESSRVLEYSSINSVVTYSVQKGSTD